MKTKEINGVVFAVGPDVCPIHKTALVAHPEHIEQDLCEICHDGIILELAPRKEEPAEEKPPDVVEPPPETPIEKPEEAPETGGDLGAAEPPPVEPPAESTVETTYVDSVTTSRHRRGR